MTVFSSIYGIIAVSLIFLMHILGRLLPGIYGKAARYINIILHIPLGLLVVFLGAPIEEGVLLYMGSLFCYLLLWTVCRRAGKEEKE